MNRNLSILIVDDDVPLSETLADILVMEGYQAEPVFSSEQAVERMMSNGFDCMIADIKMPGMNGVEMYKRIRRTHPHIPVVLMTAYTEDALVAAGRRAGVIAVLSKPLEIRHILAFLAALSVRRPQTGAAIDEATMRLMHDTITGSRDEGSVR